MRYSGNLALDDPLKFSGRSSAWIAASPGATGVQAIAERRRSFENASKVKRWLAASSHREQAVSMLNAAPSGADGAIARRVYRAASRAIALDKPLHFASPLAASVTGAAAAPVEFAQSVAATTASEAIATPPAPATAPITLKIGSSEAKSPLPAAPTPAAAPSESLATSATIDGGTTALADWKADWRAQALTTPCGSCTGRACTVCSIRVGGAPAVGGHPTGYAPRVLQYYDPAAATDVVGQKTATNSAAPGLTPNAVSAAATSNAIVLENQKQGTPESEWLIGTADPTIEGFAAEFSINHGQTVNFKIDTDSTNYVIDIYRIGYYNGDGARKVATINQQLTTAQNQPVPLFDPTRRLVDAGNWSVSASWTSPADAVSGIYFAKLTRLDGGGGENMIPFIVRDDDNPSDVTFQTSDTTWQAYNWWGGYNLYGGIDAGGRAGRASAVSYNRPITTRDGGFAAGPQDFIFGAEYPAIRWLEQNGYDINYITGIDTARAGAQLLNSKIFLSVGHDEYWSADQRENVEAARDAGVNLSFWSGNEVYWQTRWETSIDGSGTPYKTMVAYKEIWANDNVDTNGTTSTWRDPALGSGRPENSLTGTMFTVDSYRLDTMTIPYDLSNFRFWSNTAVADIAPGEVYSLTKNLLGYEWDSDVDNGFRPAGLVPLSSTDVDVNSLLLDYGNTTGAGTANHALTMYRAPSGALVFGAGTVYWSWGLDANHDNEVTPTDRNVQQAMVNLFADMGVQPATLVASLAAASKSTDTIAPTSTVVIPNTTSTYTAAQTIVISGTATDTGGGSVAVVEVSTDGGVKWHRATGYQNWTYSWVPLAGGTYTIKSRAVDDSVNLETPGAGRTITVGAAPTTSLFNPTDVPATPSSTDQLFVNLGMRFTSSQAGSIVGLKFYKGIGDGGTHVGSLWSSTGTLLGRATFTAESASGWQTVTLSNPVSVAAGTTYVVSYNSQGRYAVTDGYFSGPRTNGPLTAPVGNGYFRYGTGSAFPTNASNGSNYWVDVVFSPTNTQNEVPVGTNDNGYAVTRNTPYTFTAASLLANDTDPNGDILTITGVGSANGGVVSLNTQTNIVTFTPNAGYTGPASFGYSISDGRGGTGSAFVNMTVIAPPSGVSLFSGSDTPSNLSTADNAQVNLGMRFTASSNGTITGIKYYKGANDNGAHTGSLWSSTGTLLATANFVNETASGWQTLGFTNPVSITAGTTYVASYHSFGRYASTPGYFTTARTNGPLSAPTNNGVYTYGAGNLFPTSTFNSTNYWVDVLFETSDVNQAPVGVNDTGFTTSRDTAVSIGAAALLGNDTDANSDPLIITGVSAATNGTVSFNAQTNIVTFTPTAGYTGASGFSYALSDGRGGTSSANVSLTVTTPPSGVSLFAPTDTPTQLSDPDTARVNLGVRFSASSNGTITAIKYYKGANDTGTHTGSLWTSTGTLLATATFTNETASGWQTVSLSNPISITAGTTYVASYHSNGRYTNTSGYFASPRVNGPLSTPTSAGVYAYGTAIAFPTNTFGNANYWVDVLFNPAAVVNQNPVAVNNTGFTTTQNNAVSIAASVLLANDSDPDGGVLTVTGVSAPANGTVVFNAQTNVVTFTPTAGYTGAASFTYAISDGQGGSASATVGLTVSSAANQQPTANNDTGFTTQQNAALTIGAAALLSNDADPNGDTLTITGVSAPANGTVAFNAQTNVVTFTPTSGYAGPASFTYAISDGRGGVSSATAALNVTAPPAGVSLFAANATPATLRVNDTNSVELGMKFTASQNGTITGIKFYKGAQNTGPHVGSLWSSTGALLGRVTFTNETASGWQTASLATPAAITAGATYTVSYHTNGNYSASSNYFATTRTNGPLTAPSSASSGGNGVYAYGTASAFPSSTFNSTNYWVDVVFNGQLA